ncbi:autotransporter outer membrane beta-barrel domain-containing protein [Collimonas sp.]|jgi:outer membrane autotransporter protein|uniref:autotransporter family protein n=1 Tax=Collimonas sp. TaxID=1963772 RepID=UPI002C79F1CF|nr:autotransporter outer membrane beta-barrel domain-containing protein [Collimonas sp.]HWX01103.1 autotransporter outer membrane beta-barrel domain-containing protein [Collimonas sp.]
MSDPVRRRFALSAVSSLLLLPAASVIPVAAYAACSTAGRSTICDSSAANPWTTTIGGGNLTAEDGRTVIVGAGSRIAVGDANAISLRDNANIRVQNGGAVSANGIKSNGLYKSGANTIEFRSNSTLTVDQGGQVLATGTEVSAEAINPQGSGNLIVNNGTIKADHAAAIWFQNASGLNTVINNETGVLQAPGNVIGASGNGAIDFTNKGRIVGNLVFSGGNDILRLYTGSVITGSFDGGGGNNTLFLSGTGSASLPGSITHFSSLIKNDTGTWTLTTPITGVGVVEVQQGTLALSANNSAYTGTMSVDAAGTLEARAQNLPLAVADAGLVRFVQSDNGTYAGIISGTGAVEKTQGGTLTLAPTASGGNTYSGGTTLTGGTVAVGVDNALGANTGGLTFNGGTLQLLQSFDLAGSRAVTINAAGGTFDTQGFVSALTQGMTGSGSFNKAGTGTLTLAGSNTYTGGTTISAGTLQLGNGGKSGSIVGDVANNGALVFNRADNVTFAGVISGSGSVAQAGAGMTLLNAGNSYSGGTIISAGILAVGDASRANAVLSGGGNTVISSGATLGGYGSVTGTVTNSGTVAVANALSVFANSGNGGFTINGTLVNAGLVQIGGQTIGNRLNVVGNYVGQNGNIALNAYLAGDGSASDRLVISGGAASGSSSLRITNVGGPGAAIVADGIEVVQTVNGATTAANAFSLAGPLKAGAYSYYLAKGGVTSGTSENWYLRNTVAQTPTPPVVAPPPTTTLSTPPVVPPATPPVVPPATPPITPTGPTPSTGSGTIPLYRPEVPIYAEVASVARQLNIQQLATFHDRQGEQSLLTGSGELPAAWGRVWGSHARQGQDGAVSPRFDGSTTGMQVGHDLYADTGADGQRNHYGLFAGFAHATGNVNGFAMAVQNLDAGNLSIDAYSLGGYWTRVGPSGWYTDTVLMGSSLSGNPRSHDGVGAATHGRALIGSIEGGLPIRLGANVIVEPQAQVIWQSLSFNDLNDSVSTVGFNKTNAVMARIGVRLQSRFETAAAAWRPYLRLNLLRSSGSHDTVAFDHTTMISSGTNRTAGQLNTGLVATISKSASAFVTATYTANLGGVQQRTVMADAGMRWSW